MGSPRPSPNATTTANNARASSSATNPNNRPNRKQRSTVIIFDWDDTICPSTFVDQCQIQSFSDFPLHFQNLMNEIGRVAADCLEAAAQYGEVIIITNSDDGWVKYSAERYVPNLLPILPKYRIVSARTAYEQYYPGQPLCWKAAAFAHEVNEFYCQLENELKSAGGFNNLNMDMNIPGFENQPPPPDSMVSTDDSSDDSEMMDFHTKRTPRSKRKSSNGNGGSGPAATTSSSSPKQPYPKIRREVISFGDSMEERTAVKIVSSQLTALPKSVMFLTSPSPEQLIGQLVMLTGHMKYVCEQKNSLDLEISPHQAEKMAESILSKRRNGNGNIRSSSYNQQQQQHHATQQSTRSPMAVLSFHDENRLHPHHHDDHYHHRHHQNIRPTSNTIPRMRRAGSSENGGASGPVYDETFSL